MDYFKNKEQNKANAITRYTTNESKYPNLIQEYIAKSTIYWEDTKFMCTAANPNMDRNTVPNVWMVDMTSVEAIKNFLPLTKYGERIAVLNFSSYKNPGGMFLDGSMAQEESLCHNSVLFNVLSAFDISFYAKNRKELNKGLYKNRAIYSKDILFFDENGNPSFISDVITCAAPNRGPGMRYGTITTEENTEALRSRIHFIIRLADANQVGTLILGAYGCGVFKQKPKEVAQLFREELEQGYHYIRNAVFAIPDRNSKNFIDFLNTIAVPSKNIITQF